MKTHLRPHMCHDCGITYDALEQYCPKCGKKSEEDLSSFSHHAIFSWKKQALFFVAGWLGFQFLALVAQFIILFATLATNAGNPEFDIEAFGTSAALMGPSNFIAYGVLFLILALLLWKDGIKKLLRSFFDYSFLLWAVIAFVVITVVEIGYGMGMRALFDSLGLKFESNENENAIELIFGAFPALSIIFFVFVGPFCEEMAYRIGLFGILSRVNKPIAYIVSSLFFALIHFSFRSIGTPNFILEISNLPIYILGGISLTFVYDKRGFAASYTTHVMNNALALLMVSVFTGGLIHA